MIRSIFAGVFAPMISGISFDLEVEKQVRKISAQIKASALMILAVRFSRVWLLARTIGERD
jgi:hypothetical protein